ncbi:o-acyltransferase like protein [Trichonephila clavipes]|nr:o-acyltransferase like protein [Trichonephila clavipes]
MFILPLIGSGPLWADMAGQKVLNCEKRWWQVFLPVNTWVDFSSMCLLHTWYVASDVHFYCLAPIALGVLYRTGISVKAGSSFVPPAVASMTQTVGWIASATSCLTVLFATYSWSRGNTADAVEGVIYAVLHRTAWAAGVAWVLFVCAVGHGEHRTPDRKAWVRFPMPPNILRVHTEYVLVKSVGPKALRAESRVQGTGEYFPLLQSLGKIVEVEIGGVAIYSPFEEFRRANSNCHLYGAQGLGQRQHYRPEAKEPLTVPNDLRKCGNTC